MLEKQIIGLFKNGPWQPNKTIKAQSSNGTFLRVFVQLYALLELGHPNGHY